MPLPDGGGIYEPPDMPHIMTRTDDMTEEQKALDTAPEGVLEPDDSVEEALSEKQEEQQKLRKKIKRGERSVKDYQFFALRLLILLVVIWLLFFQILGVTHMPSDDMYPRLDAGDLVLFYRLDKDVRAQDIIVIEKTTPSSDGEAQLFIGRVVAVAGDTVEISDGERLIVNGSTMVESNIFYSTPRYDGFTEYPLTLGEGECFVLADSRSGGTDSRYFGPVRVDEIDGTVITIVRRNNL